MNNSFDIEEVVNTVNTKLNNGASISSIERELKLGKDTLRKRLNRAGYKFDKESKQFILGDNIEDKNISKPSNNKTLNSKQKSDLNTAKTKVELNCNSDVTQNDVEPKCNSTVTQNENIEPDCNSSVTQNEVKPECNSSVTQNAKVEPKCNLNVTQDNTESLSEKEIENKEEEIPELLFIKNNLETLQKIVEEYNLKEKSKNIKYKKDKTKVISRSFRGYKNVFDDFSEFCKKKELNQKEAVSDALALFMKLNR